jgi:hypothetical protein
MRHELTIPELIQKLQKEALRKGLDQLTEEEIRTEIKAYRREKASNVSSLIRTSSSLLS